MMSELIKKSELAYQVLHDKTKYFTDKEIIKGIFDFTSNDFSCQAIISRLTLIDSYYSTQMDKRYYGIEDVAKRIWSISPNNENEVRKYFVDFASNPGSGKIYDLFQSKNYGIHKDGTKAGKAISLLSKYAYYQTGLNFPIYDSLAKIVYPKIMRKYFPEIKPQFSAESDDIVSFIDSMNELNVKSAINNYDRLDNLLWLSGKILAGNFSLVFKEKQSYQEFANTVKKNTEESKTKTGKKIDFSERIKAFINANKNNLENIILDKDLREFVTFAINLE